MHQRYAIATTAFVPLILFLARDIRTRGESIMAGIFAGLLIALPGLLLHLAIISSYPGILDEDVPSYVIARTFGGTRSADIFVAVLFVPIV